MSKKRNPNSPNTTRAFEHSQECAAIVGIWREKRYLSVPFPTKGRAIHFRMLFYIWRKEWQQTFPNDPDTLTALEITVRQPAEFQGKWYLEFVKGGGPLIGDFLAQQGVALPERPPLPPTEPQPEDEPEQEDVGSTLTQEQRDMLDNFFGGKDRWK